MHGSTNIKTMYFREVGNDFKALAQNWEKRLLASSCLSNRMSEWNNSTLTGRIFMNFDIWVFFENLWNKLKFHYNLTTITGILHEDQYTFIVESRWVLLKMRNISDKSCAEDRITRFTFNKSPPPLRRSYHLWDNAKKYCIAGLATRNNMEHAHCMLYPKDTDKHSEYVILIAFPLQQWLHECA
jgi:hypothetical protein